MDHKTSPQSPDYGALAQRYLELWQEQVARLAKDPSLSSQTMSDMTTAWSQMAAAMAPPPAPAAAPSNGPGYDPKTPDSQGPESPHGAKAAPAAHGHGGVDPAGGDGGSDPRREEELRLRVSILEHRVAILESQLGQTPKSGPKAKLARPRAPGGGGSGGKKS